MPLNVKSKVRLFADDTIAYIAVTSQDDQKQLQEDLNCLACWEQKWQMEFHPKKCQVLSISRKRTSLKFDYTLHGHSLEHVSEAKYLGVNFASDLRWNNHVNMTAKKANNTLNFLRRNLRIQSEKFKTAAYNSLVRPQLEYATCVWDPYIEKDIKKIEMVQRRAARYVTNRYHNTSSVSNMLEHLGWQTLQERREQHRLNMFYKMNHGKVAIHPSEYLDHNTSERAPHSQSYTIPFSRTDYHKFSFFPRTVRDWNLLSEKVVSSPSVDSFTAQLKGLRSNNNRV